MIRLQFSRQADLISSLIAYYSAGNLSHVDVCLSNGYLLGSRSDRVGGKPSGVQIRPPNYAKFALKVVMSLPSTAEQEQAFQNFLYAQLGKPYDKTAILGFVVGRNWREDDSWYCSELVSAALESAGIFHQLYLAANKITPVALALAVSAHS